MSELKQFSDLNLVRLTLTNLVSEVKHLYEEYLFGRINAERASDEIRGVLKEHSENLVPDLNSMVILFPEGLPFLHINQTYYAPSSYHEYRVNLNFALTPTPSGNRSVFLVHPNVVINDSQTTLFDMSPLEYTVRPIFKGRDTTKECLVKEHHLDWTCHQKSLPLYLCVHPGDRIIFHAKDGLDYTVTSCNSRYEIPVNAKYDLTLLDGNQAEITFNEVGDYYFVSRPHQRQLQLYVHVKSCQSHR